MKSIKDIAQEIESKRTAENKDSEVSRSQEFEKNYLYEVLAGIADYLVEAQSQDDKKREVSNFPKIQKIVGTVKETNSSGLLKLGTLILNAIKSIKFPVIQRIQGEVEVKNQVVIPEVKIPEYPKQIKSDITSLPKYVADKLDALKKSIDSLEVKPEVKVNVDNKEPVVRIDLSGVKNALEDVLEAVKNIEVSPQVNIDSDGIIKSNKNVQDAIESIRFPVPNFKSSWAQSFSMRSEDLGKDFTYATVGGKKAIESITIHDIDGTLRRKTYTYTNNDPDYPDAESAWTEV